MKTLVLEVLPDRLTICRLAPDTPLEQLGRPVGFWSVTRTDDELSVIVTSDEVPADCPAESGWRCLAVEGPLPFAMTGVLSGLTVPLADAGISVFAISTFNTDYLLVREQALARAVAALRNRGHEVRHHGVEA